MSTTISRDGTPIAYECIGEGPPVILVDGAMCYRASGPSGPLAKQLASSFTVYTYDRRGRGESGDAAAYAIEREVEDLEVIVKEAGGSACVYGISSGAALVLEAAKAGVPMDKVALYEAPFIVDSTRPAVSDEYVASINALAATDPSAAVKLFMRQVGVPGPAIAVMRLLPMWRKLTGIAHTLPYDTELTARYQRGTPLPEGELSSVAVPALVIDGGKSPAWMRNGNRAIAQSLPNASYRTLPGQNHMVKPAALAPVLAEFFNS